MPQTLTSADAILKDVYEGPVIEQLNYKTYMIDQIERETQFQMTARGRKAILAAHVGRNRGRGARGDGGTLPVAGEQKWEDIQVPINYFYQGIELTDASIEATKSNDGAFVSLLDAEVKGATQDMKKDVNRQVWGPGNGILATCVSAASAVVTVDSVQYCKIGDPVAVLVTATGATTAGVTPTTISAINPATPSITLAAAPATPASINGTYSVYLLGSRNLEMTSMQQICSTSRTLFGVNSATAGNEWWNSQVINVGSSAAAPAIAGETAFELIADRVGETGQGETESYVTTRGIRRRLADTFQSTKRFTNREAVQIHGGYSAIMVASGSGERPVVVDDDCPKQNVFALDKSALRWYQQTTPGFLADPKSGQILHLKTTGSSGGRDAVWQGWMRWYASLASTAPNRLGRLQFCTDDAPSVIS
jgi:hypothetical protein